MNSTTLLKGFVVTCLVLLLAVSLGSTFALARNFIPDTRLALAFALAIELGIIGLGIGVYVQSKNRLDPRAFSYTLVGVLALSVLANFLHGADTFNPAAAILNVIRGWSGWWLLPLVFAAPVPVLALRMTELATKLWLDDAGTTTSNHQQPTTTTGLPTVLPGQPAEMVIQVIRIYQQQPATPLPKLAELLEVSATEASRLRLQAMHLGLLERKTRGYYLPVVPLEQLLLTSGNGDGQTKE